MAMYACIGAYRRNDCSTRTSAQGRGERIVPHARRCRAAADLEGFAHSAAAGPESAHEAQQAGVTHPKYRLEVRIADFS